jgi:hypothetical protein
MILYKVLTGKLDGVDDTREKEEKKRNVGKKKAN